MGSTRSPSSPVARRRGRPRSETARKAILTAAIRLARTRPLAAVSVDELAAEAGVGKQTIYRWWPGKAAVLLEALGNLAASEIPEGDHGSFEADLFSFLNASFALADAAGILPALRFLVAQAQADPALASDLRRQFVERRRAAVRRLLARAAERGELHKGTDRELLVDLVYGVMWYRILIGHAALDTPLAKSLARAVARAGAVRKPTDRSPKAKRRGRDQKGIDLSKVRR